MVCALALKARVNFGLAWVYQGCEKEPVQINRFRIENGSNQCKRRFRSLLIRAAAMSNATSTVLVIDDDPDVRASVGRLLRSLGINVQLFASISDFLKSYAPDGPTCLVLDVR